MGCSLMLYLCFVILFFLIEIDDVLKSRVFNDFLPFFRASFLINLYFWSVALSVHLWKKKYINYKVNFGYFLSK